MSKSETKKRKERMSELRELIKHEEDLLHDNQVVLDGGTQRLVLDHTGSKQRVLPWEEVFRLASLRRDKHEALYEQFEDSVLDFQWAGVRFKPIPTVTKALREQFKAVELDPSVEQVEALLKQKDRLEKEIPDRKARIVELRKELLALEQPKTNGNV